MRPGEVAGILHSPGVKPAPARASLGGKSLTHRLLRLIRRGLVLTLILAALCGTGATAQSGDNLPPVAAPTSRVEVGAIAVVRSGVERAHDFLDGLLRGLRADERLQGVTVAVVQDQHPALQVSAGAVNASTKFPAGGLERAFDLVAIQQLIEAGRLRPGPTLAAATAGRTDNAELARLIGNASGLPPAAWLEQHLFRPFGMSATRIQDGALWTNPADMIRFASALLQAPGGNGWASGLPELRRNGWRALQIDASAGGFSSRLVVVPEAKLAYVLLARGQTGARFWRALDDNVFDELLPPRPAAPTSASSVLSKPDADAVAGIYEPDRALRSFVFLKFPERELRAEAGDNGALVLSGAETAILLPQAGGGWASRDGNLSATRQGDELFLSSGAAYRPVPFYKRPAIYALLALAVALGTIGFALFGRADFPPAWLNSRRRNVPIG